MLEGGAIRAVYKGLINDTLKLSLPDQLSPSAFYVLARSRDRAPGRRAPTTGRIVRVAAMQHV
jgi:hypothetical protein